VASLLFPVSVVDVLLKMAVVRGLMFIFATASFVFVSASNKRTLVLLDNWTIRETHSIFFKTLRGKQRVMHVSNQLDVTKQLVHSIALS